MIEKLPAVESDNSQFTKDKVTSLFKDGLKLRDVEYENVEIWKTKNDKPGIVMLKMKTKADVSKIMKAKSNLKNSEQYKHVYLSDTEKKTTLNMRAMLKAVGKDN